MSLGRGGSSEERAYWEDLVWARSEGFWSVAGRVL